MKRLIPILMIFGVFLGSVRESSGQSIPDLSGLDYETASSIKAACVFARTGIGLFGACKVHVDGIPVNSCRVRTADVEGQSILTIEGLAQPYGRLHPLQRAWIAERVPQCGYCQTGQIMQAAALLSRNPRPSEEEIIAAMAGNLCRCGTYDRIKRAIRRAANQLVDAGTRANG